MRVKLRITGRQHQLLRAHLFPGDGLEAAAVALCGRRVGDDFHALSVRRIVPIPYEECVRERDRLTWPTARLEPLLLEAMKKHQAVLKFHSHPQNYPQFSAQDDRADRELFSSVHGWVDDDLPHASVVFQEDGRAFGRWADPACNFQPLDSIAVAGDDIHFWHASEPPEAGADADLKNVQAFGEGTIRRLRQLTIAVVGCSGTGSPLIEQLARYRVGRLIIVDPDRVEDRNLNRIIHATKADADAKALKVEVIARAIVRMGLGTRVDAVPGSICDPAVVEKVAEADVVFGCMDGTEGRAILNRLACFYSLPYFDVGVPARRRRQGRHRPDVRHRELPPARWVESFFQTRHHSGRGRGGVDEAEDAGALRGAVEGAVHQGRRGRTAGGGERQHALREPRRARTARPPPPVPRRTERALRPLWKQSGERRPLCGREGEPCRVLAREAGRGDVDPLLDMPAMG